MAARSRFPTGAQDTILPHQGRRQAVLACQFLSRPLRRISRVAIHLFADDSFGRLVQIFVERRAQLLILGPQRLIDERRRNPHHHGGVALPLVAIRLQPVAAAQRREQTPLPPVRHAELEFPRLLGLLRDAERLLDALDGRRRGVAFPRRGGAFEQSRDLAQPGPELFLGDHRDSLIIPGVGQALSPANISVPISQRTGTMLAISAPIASDAVAAGLGALSTCSALGRAMILKSCTISPLGTIACARTPEPPVSRSPG